MTEHLRLALEKRKQLRQELGEAKWRQHIDEQIELLFHAWEQLSPCVVDAMTDELMQIHDSNAVNTPH